MLSQHCLQCKSKLQRKQSQVCIVIAFFLVASFPGCLFVRTTEHIVTINDNRSGDAVIHLTDIRSDAQSDSLVRQDFDDLMSAYGAKKVDEFEQHGRRITSKRLRVAGDTLMAEVTYTFNSLDAIDGLRMTKDGLMLVFLPEREVLRTNGKISQTDKKETCIKWDRDARRLVYEVREKDVPRSVSLAFLYRKYVH